MHNMLWTRSFPTLGPSVVLLLICVQAIVRTILTALSELTETATFLDRCQSGKLTATV